MIFSSSTHKFFWVKIFCFKKLQQANWPWLRTSLFHKKDRFFVYILNEKFLRLVILIITTTKKLFCCWNYMYVSNLKVILAHKYGLLSLEGVRCVRILCVLMKCLLICLSKKRLYSNFVEVVCIFKMEISMHSWR